MVCLESIEWFIHVRRCLFFGRVDGKCRSVCVLPSKGRNYLARASRASARQAMATAEWFLDVSFWLLGQGLWWARRRCHCTYSIGVPFLSKGLPCSNLGKLCVACVCVCVCALEK